MKFAKTKLKRCKDCAYYKQLGNLHVCYYTKYMHPMDYEPGDYIYGCVIRSIPLICFKKKVKK